MLIPKPYRVLDQFRYEELLKIEKLYSDQEKSKKTDNASLDVQNKAMLKEGHGSVPLSNILQDKEKINELEQMPNSLPETKPPQEPSKEQFSSAVEKFKEENPDVLQKQQEDVLKSEINPLCNVSSKYRQKATKLLDAIQKFQDPIYDKSGRVVVQLTTFPDSDIETVMKQLYNDDLSLKDFYKTLGLSELVDYIKDRGLLDLIPTKIKTWTLNETRTVQKIIPKERIIVPKGKDDSIPLNFFSIKNYV